MCPHTAMCVSSYCYKCVVILLYVCPHTAICVLITLYVSSYCYVCVLILLYLCPHATTYGSLARDRERGHFIGVLILSHPRMRTHILGTNAYIYIYIYIYVCIEIVR